MNKSISLLVCLKPLVAPVGGPDQYDNWADDRTDYVRNEVTLDYNAAFTGKHSKIYLFIMYCFPLSVNLDAFYYNSVYLLFNYDLFSYSLIY